MPGKTAKVTITERQHDLLETIHKAPTASSQLRQRAAIILWAFQKRDNAEIAAAVGLSRRQVSTWRRRWADAWSGSSASSAPRPTPRSAGPSSRSSAMSPAPAPPASSLPSRSWRSWHWPASPRRSPAGRSLTGRPRSWPTRPSRRHRALDLGHSSGSLSPRGRLAAAQERYWLNTREKDPVVFAGRVQAVCDTYQESAGPERGTRGRAPSAPMR